MHYLVTGGAGFIGSHLSEALLDQGHQVSIIDDFNDYYDPEIKRLNISGFLDRITLIEGDIRDTDLIERIFSKGKFDAIVHLATQRFKDVFF